ncbi:hypothetical protein MNBD_NITROSPINAE04-1523 [hydrothermal vent metagenome]|uniref:Histidine kinase n=1 Tax=hydrothermal vent metagenome TaxID=652676 RepID=A0A3B1C7V4_9ZZZZ
MDSGFQQNLSDASAPLRSILIVDDETMVSSMLQKMIEKEGHNVQTCNDAFKALEILNNKHIDIMISDLRMPGMDGVELVQQAKEMYDDLDVVVITGYGTMDMFINSLHAGAVDFILKPIDKDLMLHTINRLLEKRTLTENFAARTQQLVQSEKMATVGLLSTGIAHEINNPTTFVRTNLQLMKEYIKRLKPRLEDLSKPENVKSITDIIGKEFPEMIDEALKGTHRIEKIVTGIKHYAHMGDDNADERVDIREVISQAVNLVRSKLRKQVTITENYMNIKEITGQFSRLEQVFVNLLVNAADAINDKIKKMYDRGNNGFIGIIDVSATIIEGDEVEGGKTPDYLVLTFYDNGDGVPEEKINRIFDPFFTTKGVGVGTGLGLYICYEIIQQHEGDISVHSEKGEGTAFTIKLPVKGNPKVLGEKV